MLTGYGNIATAVADGKAGSRLLLKPADADQITAALVGAKVILSLPPPPENPMPAIVSAGNIFNARL